MSQAKDHFILLNFSFAIYLHLAPPVSSIPALYTIDDLFADN